MHSSLARRLGIQADVRIALVNEPDGFRDRLGPLPPGVRFFERATEPLDVIVYFSDTLANIEKRIPLLARYLASPGVLWMAYPSPKSPVRTDVSFDAVTRIGANAGLVPRGSSAIAEEWDAVLLSAPPRRPT